MSHPDLFQTIDFSQKYKTTSIASFDIEELSNKLKIFMEKEKPYLDPKISLAQLAQSLDLNTHLLSRVINERFVKNFFEFINTYRVEEFKNLVSKSENKNYTLLSIAYDSGFNSKTTFNTAFKKITKQTPKEYLTTLSS